MKTPFFWILTIIAAAGQVLAAPLLPAVKVIPWNGHKAASSLTFDDGDPSHLDVVVPELNKRKMRGTFFLIVNQLSRKDEWRKILESGDEIGNHTLDHKHAAELTPRDEEAQVVGAQNVLQNEFGVPVLTFAYPYVEISPGLKAQVEKSELLARGGNSSYVLNPEVDPDWWNIPSRTTMTDLPFSAYQSWIDEDLKSGGWLVWMIHGLEGTRSGWEPITKKIFGQILDDLQSKDIWVGTFLEVGAYFRAQKVFEKSVPVAAGNGETWKWEVPPHFPSKVFLKVNLEGDAVGYGLWQGDQKLTPGEKGIYKVDFNLKTLTLRPSKP